MLSHQITGVDFPKDSREYKLRQMMCKLWTNFAKYGEPTPNHEQSTVKCKWSAAKKFDREAEKVEIDYLRIDNDGVTMHKDLYQKRMEFWRGIYEKHNQSFLNPKFPVQSF